MIKKFIFAPERTGFCANPPAITELLGSAQTTTNLGQPSRYANRFVARHGGVGILTFVDGHAAGFTDSGSG